MKSKIAVIVLLVWIAGLAAGCGQNDPEAGDKKEITFGATAGCYR